MKPFLSLRGVAAPIPHANIDTDQIVPARFLTTVERKGLAKALFYNQRFDADGKPIAGFVLDAPVFCEACILVAGDNFGCGSSREHAAWALLDAGIGCVISTSFAEIFYLNAVGNGLLPAIVPVQFLNELLTLAAAGKRFTIDLQAQEIAVGERRIPFEINPKLRRNLMTGLDAVRETMAASASITALENRLAGAMPWLARSKNAQGRPS